MLEESEEMGERVWGNKRKNRRKVRKKILPQEDLFTNYNSSIKLTPAMKSVLNKGNLFCPGQKSLQPGGHESGGAEDDQGYEVG